MLATLLLILSLWLLHRTLVSSPEGFLPWLSGLAATHVEDGLAVVAVNLDEDFAAAKTLLKELCADVIVVHDPECARLTGSWRDRIGRTECLSAAHDGPELALLRFDLRRLADAERELLSE